MHEAIVGNYTAIKNRTCPYCEGTLFYARTQGRRINFICCHTCKHEWRSEILMHKDSTIEYCRKIIDNQNEIISTQKKALALVERQLKKKESIEKTEKPTTLVDSQDISSLTNILRKVFKHKGKKINITA